MMFHIPVMLRNEGTTTPRTRYFHLLVQSNPRIDVNRASIEIYGSALASPEPESIAWPASMPTETPVDVR